MPQVLAIMKQPIIAALLLSFVDLSCRPVSRGGELPLIKEGEELQVLSDQFVFTEGPAADAGGNLYFTDNRVSKIHIWTLDGELKTFREDTGGGNGLSFDEAGNLYICEGDNRRIGMVSADGDYSVVADQFEGRRFNRPNDLWIDPKGGIYFSDRISSRVPIEQEQEGNHLYYITPDDRRVLLVVDDLQRPNGLIGTADGRHLYATDQESSQIFVWDIQPDGRLTNKRFFSPGGSDGMTLDEKGNLYITTDAVEIFDSEGQAIGRIEVPVRPRNVAFGGRERKTLFITAENYLYALEMNVRGQH